MEGPEQKVAGCRVESEEHDSQIIGQVMFTERKYAALVSE